MTFPRVVKLLLIFAPSFSLVPLAPVDSALSDPARSTRDTLLTFVTKIFKSKQKIFAGQLTFSAVRPLSWSCLCWVKMMVKTAWERLLVSFILVAATVLALLPSSMRS